MDTLEWLFGRWLLIMWKAFYVLGPMFLIFWILKPRWLQKFRIPQRGNIKPRFVPELFNSILGLSVYLIPLFLLVWLNKEYGYTKMYMDINEYGLTYYFFSFFLYAFVIDTWFYWAHRAMHTFPILIKFHNVHHKSININPMTSYSFHIGEAIINMLPYGIFIFTIPFHPSVLALSGTFGILYTGYIHLGYDIPQSWRDKFPPLRLMYSCRQHAIHHQEFKHNYAVYFNFWDKLMGTEKLPTKATQ